MQFQHMVYDHKVAKVLISGSLCAMCGAKLHDLIVEVGTSDAISTHTSTHETIAKMRPKRNSNRFGKFNDIYQQPLAR